MKVRLWGIISFIFALCLILFGLEACSGISSGDYAHMNISKISRAQFSEDPFGCRADISSFKRRYSPPLKVEKYIVTGAKPTQRDTIYRFAKHKTKILFYKPQHLPEKLMAGTIRHKRVFLRNGIHVSMSRKEFFWRFDDWPYDDHDKLQLQCPNLGCVIYFIFKGDKLSEIRIGNK